MTLRRGPALIPIGSFSSVTHLTQKTLRFYAEQGILNPAWVDPENGYRYYRSDQITQARRIQMLREIGMSLSEIDAVNSANLQSPEASSKLVHQHFLRRQAQFHSECETYRALVLGLLDEQPLEDTRARAVSTREVSGGPVLALEISCSTAAMGEAIGEAAQRLATLAEHENWPVRGPAFVRHFSAPFVNKEEQLQACLPLVHSITPPEGFRLWQDKPHSEAWLDVCKEDLAYPRFLAAIESLVEWLVSNNRIFVGFASRVTLGPGHPREFVWPYINPEDEEGDLLRRPMP